MDERDWDLEEKKLLEATLKVIQITSALTLQNPQIAQEIGTSSPDSGSGVFNYDSQHEDYTQTEVEDQTVPDEDMCGSPTSTYVKPPPLIPINPPKPPTKADSKYYKITFYFSDGESKTCNFLANSTYNDVLRYLKNGKYRTEDWTSIYCDIRCRDPKMNLGKMKVRQTLSQTKLPEEFSVDVKIKNLF